MTPEEKRQLLEDRAAKLSSFKAHPHWPELLDEFDRKRRRQEHVFTNYLKAGNAAQAQREFDRAKGFDLALQWVVSVVEHAEDTLTRALRESDDKEGD